MISPRPPGVFEKSALTAVKKWHYEPLSVNGSPVEIPVRTSIRFEPLAGAMQRFARQVVAVEIDAPIAVDLKIEISRRHQCISAATLPIPGR